MSLLRLASKPRKRPPKDPQPDNFEFDPQSLRRASREGRA